MDKCIGFDIDHEHTVACVVQARQLATTAKVIRTLLDIIPLLNVPTRDRKNERVV